MTKLELALITSLIISIVLIFVLSYLLKQAHKLANEYYAKYRTEQNNCSLLEQEKKIVLDKIKSVNALIKSA